jgi:glycosyltransferase involved in cell wall biosynthesis
MKIDVFGTRGFPLIQGGVEKHCECLYPLLDDTCRVTVFRRRPYVRPGATCKNIGFIDLPSTRIKGVEAVIHSFLATLWCMARQPDVVHIHNIGPALFSPLLKLARLKVVLTYHSPNYEHEKWGFFSRKLLRLSERIALSTADAVIFINEMQRRKYSERIRRKSYFIPNGIQPPQFISGSTFLQSIGVRPKKYILAVGRITPEKGFDCLLRAFEQADTGEYGLVIAGGVEGEQAYFEKLKRSVRSGKTVFTGYVYGEELAQLYTHAALFVLPSYHEGLPLVLLEAMSYRLAILASDIEANRAVGLPSTAYFPTGNERELALRLSEALHRDAPPDVAYAGLDAYDWQQVARQTLAVYRRLA